MTVPNKVQIELGVKEEDIVGFYEDDGKIGLRKMK